MRGHDPDVAAWLYKMMNDPEYFEKFRYVDSINNYNNIIDAHIFM
jgi:hypothetical protein